jgi:hypothetical protein
MLTAVRGVAVDNDRNCNVFIPITQCGDNYYGFKTYMKIYLNKVSLLNYYHLF